MFDDVADVVDTIRGPVPEEWRQAGFERAKKADIYSNISELTDLWEKV